VSTLSNRQAAQDAYTDSLESLGQRAKEMLDAMAEDLVAYRAGHKCRKCGVHITDMEYIASSIFLSLCPADLARAIQTVREMSV
jgi:hypothetical protein